ncbi:phosphotransferase [Tumebacillus sp. ITR2]|uniref:Phosphotransferase n=1 Tax=Tumebacillus amylolyticus TaxID=2801339 RepID=A0ABS1J4M2_9BACL|nr:phosphotransferase [Tumebacillus amylolyticus]
MSSLDVLLGQGRTAEVYAWGEGLILKLYRTGFPKEWVDHEFRVARAVRETGVDAPDVRERVHVEGREGIVYERVEGSTLLGALQIGWSPERIGEVQAELHVKMQGKTLRGVQGLDAAKQEASPLPSMRVRLQDEISRAESLSEDVRSRVLDVLASLPDEQALLHGDFHPENILLTQTRGPVVIDWTTATIGHPLADVARSSLLLTLAALPPGLEGNPVIEAMRQTIHDAYLAHYHELTHTSPADLLPWKIVSAAARLSEKLPQVEHDRVRAFLETNLIYNL